MKKLVVLAIGLGLLCVVALVIARLPASVVADAIGKSRGDFTCVNPTGTLWQGKCSQISLADQHLGQTEWDIDPVAFFSGELAMDFLVQGDIRASGVLVKPLFGKALRFDDVDAEGPADLLQIIVQEPFLRFDGRLHGELAQVRFDEDGYLSGLEGEMRWQAAQIVGQLAADLGNLQVNWTSTDNRVVGALQDHGGPLGLFGEVVLQNREYNIDALLHDRNEQVPLRQAFYVLGQPDREGQLKLRINGPLLSIWPAN